MPEGMAPGNSSSYLSIIDLVNEYVIVIVIIPTRLETPTIIIYSPSCMDSSVVVRRCFTISLF